MSNRRKLRGRPLKYPMPELKPHPDGREITPESLAEAFLRLPANHEWKYLKQSGLADDELASA